MSMQVTPISKTLAEVFRGNFLRIPRFQRPYSWEREELSEFWYDLVERHADDYFMGSMVVYRDTKENNLYYIVDGQQRLTTITITLALIRDFFDAIGATEPANGIHNLIETTDLDDKRRFVLEHDEKNSFFQRRIQQRNPDRSTKPQPGEQTALAEAHTSLYNMLFEYLDTAAEEAAPGEEKAAQRTALSKLRNRLLALQFISIELVNEDDAYLIFETLNTRGKDLQIADLVKNLFTRLIKVPTKGMDTVKERWTEILSDFNRTRTPIDTDTFLVHFWLANREYVSKARLFKQMKATIKQSNASEVLADIYKHSKIYVKLSAPMESRWAKEERELRDSLSALSIFRVAQAYPLLLAVMTAYTDKRIKLAAAKRTIAHIEKFTFQFNAITSSRGGGGIANMYAKLAQSVSQCDGSQSFALIATEIKDKLVSRVPRQSEFEVGFENPYFFSDFTRDRPLIRYILMNLSQFYGLPKEVDAELYTIEHLWPESRRDGLEDWVAAGRLGNLLFVPEDVNRQLGDKSFGDKLAILKKQRVPMDPFLADAKRWDERAIEQRGKLLAAAARLSVWNI